MLPRRLSWVVGVAMVVMAKPFVKVNPSNDRPFKELYGDVGLFLEEEPNSVVVVCPEYFDLNYAYHLAPETFTQRPTQRSLPCVQPCAPPEFIQYGTRAIWLTSI